MFDPTRDEMLAHLSNHKYNDENCYFDFERESAIYWFASDWHGGQNSNLYSALSQSQYSPGPFYRGIRDENEFAQAIYKELEVTYAPL